MEKIFKFFLPLLKRNINFEIDCLIEDFRKITKSYDGKICSICGVEQGSSMNGFKHFYCEHLTKSIDERLKKQKQILFKKVFLVTS